MVKKILNRLVIIFFTHPNSWPYEFRKLKQKENPD